MRRSARRLGAVVLRANLLACFRWKSDRFSFLAVISKSEGVGRNERKREGILAGQTRCEVYNREVPG